MTDDHGQTIPERDHARLSFSVPCEVCGEWTERHLGEPGSQPLPDAATCGGCGTPQALDLAGHVDAAGRLDGCPRCDYHTLCIQKDVNPRLGVILVVVSYAILLALRLPIPWLVGALIAMTALDVALLRLVVKRFLFCYRCKAQFRGWQPGERCRPFDLATWEVHDPPAEG